MNIALINMTEAGSTGKIMISIAKHAMEEGTVAYTYAPYPYNKDNKDEKTFFEKHKRYGSFIERHIHNWGCRILGLNGLLSFCGTRQLLKDLKKKQIGIVHLHNLHGYCINFPLLFRYIKKNHINVVWTLHDCWAFTGHCPHFDIVHCEKWKTGCYHCSQLREYPQSLLDSSQLMWKLKKKWFSGVNGMTIVTPSQWLAGLVKQSYLKEYPVKVIHNGIDLSVFKPTPSEFRPKHNISDGKYILLGVAFGWGVRKGLDVFIELANRLPQDQYQIVLVGTDENTDKQLPDNIISIHRTQNQRELAEIYTASDLFVNPTREEVFGLVNAESLACGTPVLTFKTGGCPEIIDNTCGSVVEKDDVNSMEREIIRICTDNSYSAEACLNRAKAFDMNERLQEYVDLYEEL